MRYCTDIEKIGDYDVIIAGGGPSGIAAAVAASRLGTRALIVERAGAVGGNLTIGHVSPILGGYVKNSMADYINCLIGERFSGVHDFENAKAVLTGLLHDNNVDVFLNSSVCDVIKDGGRISSVVISSQQGLKAVDGRMFIDCTGDGVLSFLAGEEIEYGRDDGLVQPASLMFTISGIDESQPLICYDEKHDTALKKGSYLKLCRDACESGELPHEINIVRLYSCPLKTERVVNATQINRLNPLDLKDYTKAQAELRKQIQTVVSFLKNNIEGFENIRVKDSSDIVGFRESRRVKGQYTLSAEDLLSGKRFDDVIVHKASFPLDIHNPDGAGQAESDSVPVQVGAYDIPYGTIVPLLNDNLYVAGRCISGTHRAHASYRVMNHAMNIGEAAGISAALCVTEKCTNKTLDPKKTQKVLLDRGIELF